MFVKVARRARWHQIFVIFIGGCLPLLKAHDRFKVVDLPFFWIEETPAIGASPVVFRENFLPFCRHKVFC